MINKYNQIEMAQYILENGFISNRKFYELNIIARYLHMNDKSKLEIEKIIIQFCETYFKDFNYIRYYQIIDSIINNCHKYPLKQLGSLKISKSDISLLDGFEDFELKKVIFTILILYKINILSGRNNFVRYDSYPSLAKMIHLKKPKKLPEYIKALQDYGYIRLCMNRAIECLFAIDMNDDTEEIIVNDINNCGLYYTNYINGGYIECSECKTIVKKNSNRQIYCNECKTIKEKEKKLKYYHKKSKKI